MKLHSTHIIQKLRESATLLLLLMWVCSAVAREKNRTIALPFEDSVYNFLLRGFDVLRFAIETSNGYLLFSATLSKHSQNVSSYDAVEFQDFKSQYATVADYKSATTELGPLPKIK